MEEDQEEEEEGSGTEAGRVVVFTQVEEKISTFHGDD